MQHISLFDYHLPKELIAQEPLPQRDHSRLLVFDRSSGTVHHRLFRDIGKYLLPGDLLVLNDVRVIPARIFAKRKTGGKVEVFILDAKREKPSKVLLKPMKRIRIGETLLLPDNWSVTVLNKSEHGCTVQFDGTYEFSEFINKYGQTPLPPYIRRSEKDERVAADKKRYQTIFARHDGAIAAPTAGLHFTPQLMQSLHDSGVKTTFITLWVGWGTFKPVTCDFIEDHLMEKEYFQIRPETALEIKKALKENRRIIAVGTTTTRALESWANSDPDMKPVEEGIADIFIYPGYSFNLVNALVTNFHLPKSTLLMLVSAFAGRKNILKVYKIAVEQKYRFFSYGDAMLIL